MRRLLCSLLLLSSACALVSRKPAASSLNSQAVSGSAPSTPATGQDPAPNQAAVVPAADATSTEAEEDEADVDGEDADDETAAVEEEGESHELSGANANLLRYTSDLSDEQLAELWKGEPSKLGSTSIGFVDEGRLINAEKFPRSEDWILVSPERAWATAETIQYVMTAIRQVRAEHPTAPPLRVNQLSSKEGGYLRPHKSHQNGRDVDLAFYYPTVEPIRVRAREKHIDVPRNWALIKALVTQTDVQFILVDRRIQKVIYDHALSAGEDKAWLDSLFHAGKDSLVKHARRHRDHFHVRFYNARAQELGRRVAPLLAQRPDQNIAFHRVRSGDTLGAIARRYGSSVSMLQKANRMRGSFLRLSQQLRVPLRGPCTRCPVPPPVVLPDRKLPPVMAQMEVSQASTGTEAPAVATPVAASSASPEAASPFVAPALEAHSDPEPAASSLPPLSETPATSASTVGFP